MRLELLIGFLCLGTLILIENGLAQLLLIIGAIVLAIVLLTIKDNFVKKKK